MDPYLNSAWQSVRIGAQCRPPYALHLYKVCNDVLGISWDSTISDLSSLPTDNLYIYGVNADKKVGIRVA